jgi:hypothetical protein
MSFYSSEAFSPHLMSPYRTYLQVTVSGCIYYSPFQLESINKRNQRSQTRKLNALINLCHLHRKHRVNNNNYHLFRYFLCAISWEVEIVPKVGGGGIGH